MRGGLRDRELTTPEEHLGSLTINDVGGHLGLQTRDRGQLVTIIALAAEVA